MLKLFNTMGRKIVAFKPLKGKAVRMYSCGPTVYDYAHLGHFRAYVFVDVLKRVLKYNKYKVKHVMNITDVGHLTSDADTGEDKMEVGAKREGKSVWEIAEFYTKDFFNAMEKLNVQKPDIICKATDHIKEMAEMVQKIIDNGYAYIISDGIYFDTSKLKDYGKLAGFDPKQLKAGARVEVNEEKKNPNDFALWKFTPKGQKRQMEWENEFYFKPEQIDLARVTAYARENPNIKIEKVRSKFKLTVKGFPGWHIECSAMSIKYLGKVFDIHTGGIDHIPVHHTNEVAQSKAALKKESVKFWLHNEFVLVNNQKMSKSLQNFYTMHDILTKGFDPLALRYLFLTAHYRSKVNFTWESLNAAQNAYNSLKAKIASLDLNKRGGNKKVKDYKKRFLEIINNDLDTPQAIALMWQVLKDENLGDKQKYELVLDFDSVFGLKLNEARKEIPKEIIDLAEMRLKARKEKNWELADEIREKIKAKGYKIEDTEDGYRIFKL
ncbi:MAG: cysteine--tRNA ligase [Candidatus Aenigmarchaeota archaeon]|nr:cysteine--tRNA ligase [Candidatus Aenigmarchaeota archaeon]